MPNHLSYKFKALKTNKQIELLVPDEFWSWVTKYMGLFLQFIVSSWLWWHYLNWKYQFLFWHVAVCTFILQGQSWWSSSFCQTIWIYPRITTDDFISSEPNINRMIKWRSKAYLMNCLSTYYFLQLKEYEDLCFP